MALESWITPEETPALAAAATAEIDARLARLGEAARLAYWASIRKAYNTPYNHAKPRALAPNLRPVEIVLSDDALGVDLPMAAIAAAAMPAEIHVP